MAGIHTIIDEVEALILALNPPTYFTDFGADKTSFHEPSGKMSRDLLRVQPNVQPALHTRLFVVEADVGQTHRALDGTLSEKAGFFEVHLQYYIPPRDAAREKAGRRMAQKDGEVISHAITTNEWTSSIIGPETEFVDSNDIEEIAEGKGIFLTRMRFRADYHYDGL